MKKYLFNQVSIVKRKGKPYYDDLAAVSIALPRKQFVDLGIAPKQVVEFTVNDKMLFLRLVNEKKKGANSGYITSSYQINVPLRKLPVLNEFNFPESCVRVGFTIVDDAMVIDLSQFQNKPTFAQLVTAPEPEVKKVVSFAGLKC